MSYVIDYTPGTPRQGRRVLPHPSSGALTLCWFGLFVLLVRAFWPEGTAILRRLLLGDSAGSVLACLEELTCSVQSGASLRDAAVGAFRDVLYGR